MAWVWIALKIKGLRFADIGFRRHSPTNLLAFALLGVGLAFVLSLLQALSVWLGRILGLIERGPPSQIPDLGGAAEYAVMLVTGAVLVAVVEELFFRGILYGAMRHKAGPAIAAIGSSALFAVAHVIPITMPALFVVGLILARVYERKQSLWPAIVAHGSLNGFAITIAFLIENSA